MKNELNITDNNEIINLTSQIVSSYVRSNKINKEDVPAFINSVYQELSTISENPSSFNQQNLIPAVDPSQSVFDDHIICLEDGKKLIMLKRYLKTQFNMTPDEYRTKWGLPSDYPMVCKNYARKRSEVAKANGLGKR